ncbi:MAG: efflux RND transporter periplasmic adaptor subunit, partial [Oscillospiraceae bacterium]|nr:efflux RND transporter periplasmic adaptor subunit [Oscillospiraceae bacterium]
MKKLSLLLAVILLITVFTGCGASDTENTVSVQSVSMVTGVGGVGLAQRFAGIVSARSETKIETDSQKEVGEIFVKVGDNVQVGDLLFTYDMELAELNYEKLELEIAQLKGSLEAKKEEKSTLEKEKNKASSSEQLSYTIAIAECDTAIREFNYNITLKEKELERLAESLDVVDCTSPVEGRIQSVNPDGGFDNSGNPLPFISILETGVYRVKGTVNEMNASALEMGMRVTVRSRRNENLTWSGSVATVDWENPETTNDNSYFGNNDIMTSTTKYPFYVELDDAEGLLLGEHVYIEPAIVEENEGLMLPEWYLIDIDTEAGTANIWAQNAKGKLEKRAVK